MIGSIIGGAAGAAILLNGREVLDCVSKCGEAVWDLVSGRTAQVNALKASNDRYNEQERSSHQKAYIAELRRRKGEADKAESRRRLDEAVREAAAKIAARNEEAEAKAQALLEENRRLRERVEALQAAPIPGQACETPSPAPEAAKAEEPKVVKTVRRRRAKKAE